MQYLITKFTGLVYSIFGKDGLILFQENPEVYSLILALLMLLLGGGTVFFVISVSRRFWLNATQNLELWRTGGGRKVLGLARDIRSRSRRIRRGLLAGLGGVEEGKSIVLLLERFVSKDMPETLIHAQTFISTGGRRTAMRLRKNLGQQQKAWSESGQTSDRDKLNREIAITKQLLAQTDQANENFDHLLSGLEETSRALRALEVELASLGAVRSQSIQEIQERLVEMAEGFRHQKEAHLEIQNSSE